jgi:hypothetical protein
MGGEEEEESHETTSEQIWNIKRQQKGMTGFSTTTSLSTTTGSRIQHHPRETSPPGISKKNFLLDCVLCSSSGVQPNLTKHISSIGFPIVPVKGIYQMCCKLLSEGFR